MTDPAATSTTRGASGSLSSPGGDGLVPTARMTPQAALARHVEWLEFALAAARSEETWRTSRLGKATKRNRDKRTLRLAEVHEEIEELSALLEAIRSLQAKASRRAPRAAGTKTTRRRSSGGTSKAS